MLPDSALLTRAHKKRQVTKAGLMTVKVLLSKRVSSKLRERGFRSNRLRSQSRQVTGTPRSGGPSTEIAQVSVGQQVKGNGSDKIQRATAAATEQLRTSGRAAGRTSAATSGATLASTPDTPYFNLIHV